MRKTTALALLGVFLLAGCTNPPGSQPTSTSDIPSQPTTPTTTTPAVTPTGEAPATATASPGASAGPLLKVHYVDVGQGDGTIWELPDGSVIVYDCGPAASNAASNRMVAYLASIGKAPGSHIHALIASHGHLDHIGGCEEIFSTYVVDNVYDQWYQGTDAPQSYQAFRQQVRDENTHLHDLQDDAAIPDDSQIQAGHAIAVTAPNISVQLLWPTKIADSWDSIAEESLVVRLAYGSVSFCFKGDIETSQEQALVAARPDVRCTVDLMTHHGSKYASSSTWLTTAKPTYAPMSFGANSYGHPTPEAMCRAQAAGAKVYATQRLGTITFSTDGNTVTVSPDQPETKDYCVAGADYWAGTPAGTPPTPASGGLSATASVDNPAPCNYSHVKVTVQVTDSSGNPVSGASVTSDWHFKSSTSHESGTTDAGGTAVLDRAIGPASANYQVDVNAHVTSGDAMAGAMTSFTPSGC